jgi:hypothetical protein
MVYCLYIKHLILGDFAFLLDDRGGRSIHGLRQEYRAEPTMSPKTRNQIDKSKEDALAAFIARKQEIDQMLARLQALSNEHFGWSPDDINWGHVGTLGHYAELLKRITDSAFNEGDHAG